MPGNSLSLSILSLVPSLALASGTWVDTSFVPPSLGFENPVMIYLPEGYDPGGSTDYQVAIWLHGWTNHYTSNTTKVGQVHDSLVAAGGIEPCIFVHPEGWCQPYQGSMWANSELYGNYEDYVIQDIIAFIDTNYCTMGDGARYIMGSSMGGSGALDLALRHPELFGCVVGNAAMPDMVVAMPYVIEEVLDECPESEPPYSYDWGNGFYTDAEFLYSGGYSPNLSAPDSIDFILDENGEVVDSVYALWETHNPAHMAKLDPPSDLLIGVVWGESDPQVAMCENNESFVDTLAELGLPHAYYSDQYGHTPPRSRCAQMMLMAMGATGVEDGPGITPDVALSRPSPNPFSTSAVITFALPVSGQARIDVHDLSGRLMATPVEAILPAGEHTTQIDGSDMPPGVYLVHLRCGSMSDVTKCVLMR